MSLLIDPYRQGVAAGAAFAFVNADYGYPGAISVSALDIPAIDVADGNHLFVHVRFEASATTVTVTDTAGNTYVPLTQSSAPGEVLGQWFYCLGAAGNAANVINVAFASARSYCWATALQFAKTVAAFDVQASGSASSGTTVSSSAFTTTAAGLILVGRGVYNQQSSVAFDSGVTVLPVRVADVALNYGAAGYLVTSSAETGKVVTETGNSSTSRCLQVAAFK